MKFAALIEYTPDLELTARTRPAHRQYLMQLLGEGTLACAGPLTDDSGALIVYETETKQQAEAILQADPFHNAGVFVRWTLYPWKVVFSNHALLPVSPS